MEPQYWALLGGIFLLIHFSIKSISSGFSIAEMVTTGLLIGGIFFLITSSICLTIRATEKEEEED